MADNSFVYDGGQAWTVEGALDSAAARGIEEQVPIALRELSAAMQPAPLAWFGKRLPVLWTLFMAGREADSRALTLWMQEMAALLADLPHDIVAHAIDEAVRKSSHGFIPSIGEIRRHADPLVVERCTHIERLTTMVAALADPDAARERVVRRERREQAQRLRQQIATKPTSNGGEAQ